jgi:hypothetical protein
VDGEQNRALIARKSGLGCEVSDGVVDHFAVLWVFLAKLLVEGGLDHLGGRRGGRAVLRELDSDGDFAKLGRAGKLGHAAF